MQKFILKSIKGKNAFRKVFESGQSFYSGSAKAVICFRDANDDSGANLREVFYAAMISKRSAKKAPVRNRVKRLQRESLRQIFNSEDNYRDIFSYIVIMRNKAPLHPAFIKLDEVKNEIEVILKKAEKYYTKMTGQSY